MLSKRTQRSSRARMKARFLRRSIRHQTAHATPPAVRSRLQGEFLMGMVTASFLGLFGRSRASA
jgi:hypothetical protein